MSTPTTTKGRDRKRARAPGEALGLVRGSSSAPTPPRFPAWPASFDRPGRLLVIEPEESALGRLEAICGRVSGPGVTMTRVASVEDASQLVRAAVRSDLAFDLVVLAERVGTPEVRDRIQKLADAAPRSGTILLLDRADPDLTAFAQGLGTMDVLLRAELTEAALERALRTLAAQEAAERTLREAEARYRALLNAAREGIALVQDGMVLEMNAAFVRLLPVPPGSPRAIALADLFDESIRATIAQRLERSDGVPFEVRTRRASGRTGDLVIVVEPHEGHGAARQIVLIRDVTTQRDAERALARSERWFRSLSEHSADILAVFTESGELRFISPAVRRLLGIDPDQVAIRQPDSFVHPDDAQVVREAVQETVAKPDATVSLRVRLRHQDGHYVSVEARGRNLLEDPVVQGFLVAARDLTDQMETEKALLESEQRFRDIFEHATVGLYRSTPDGRVMLCNQALATMVGFADKADIEAADIRVDDFYPEGSSREDWIQLMDANGRMVGSETQWKRRDGRVIWVRETARVVRAPDGSVGYYEGVVEDITQSRKAQEELVVQRQILEAQKEAAPDGILVVGLDGQVLASNMRFRHLWGFGSEVELRSIRYDEIVEQIVARTRSPAAVRARMRLRGPVATVAQRGEMQLKDGRVVEDFVRAIRRPDGTPMGRVWYFHDSTHEREAQNELERVMHQNALILNAAGEGIFGINTKGLVTFANPAAARILGYEPSELVGRDPHDLLVHAHADGSPRPRDESPILRSLIAHEVHHVADEVFWHRQGRPIPVRYVSTPVKQGDEIMGAVVVFDDITDRKRSEEQLRHRSEELESFAYAVSHDLRTPLVSLDWLVQELADDLADGVFDQQGLLDRIQSNIEAMDRLVSSLLDLARIDQDADTREAVPLADVAKDVTGGLEGVLKRRRVHVDVQAGTLPVLRGDRVRFEQVFSNLIGNAVKFVDDDVGRVIVRGIEPDLPGVQLPVRIEIVDNGPGVPEAYRDRIFRLFERAPDPAGRNTTGSGVGLALVRKIVRRYGGDLTVDEAQGGGARFTLAFPYDRVARPDAEAVDASLRVPGDDGPTPTK